MWGKTSVHPTIPNGSSPLKHPFHVWPHSWVPNKQAIWKPLAMEFGASQNPSFRLHQTWQLKDFIVIHNASLDVQYTHVFPMQVSPMQVYDHN